MPHPALVPPRNYKAAVCLRALEKGIFLIRNKRNRFKRFSLKLILENLTAAVRKKKIVRQEEQRAADNNKCERNGIILFSLSRENSFETQTSVLITTQREREREPSVRILERIETL